MHSRHNASRTFPDLVSDAKRSLTERVRWSSAEVEHIARTVAHAPKVMVKIASGGTSPKGGGRALRLHRSERL